MKSAIIYAPDWAGDEVVLVWDRAELGDAAHLIERDVRASLGDRWVAIFDRTDFSLLHRRVKARLETYRAAGHDLAGLSGFKFQLDRLAERLDRDRRDDRAGDPPTPPPTAQTVQFLET